MNFLDVINPILLFISLYVEKYCDYSHFTGKYIMHCGYELLRDNVLFHCDR